MGGVGTQETVYLLVDDAAAEAAVRKRCTFFGFENIRFHQLPTVDSWIRDYGPNFLVRELSGELQLVEQRLAYNDWIFNAWGNKYEELKKDDTIPTRLQNIIEAPRFEPGIVLEGGSIEVNGAGCVLMTEQCLLNANRNPQLDRSEIERHLHEYLGTQKVLW